MSEDPKPADDVDEFAGIHPAPPRRNPVLALAVLALGGVLIWHLRADISYAFTPKVADDLGDARNVGPAALVDNRYVTLSGQPDRRNALFLEPKGEKSRQTFFRLLGTETRLLVRAADTATRAKIEDRWTGRLRRFGALPWSSALKRYYSEEVKAARFLPLDGVRKALTDHSTSLRDRAGEPITVDASTPVHVDSLFPDDLLVTLWAEKFPDATDARHELEKLGIKVVTPRKATEAGDFDFIIAAPVAERAAVIDKLDKAQIGFAAHQERETIVWGSLKELGPQVAEVSVDSPIRIADDAWVLTEDEAPDAFLWAPIVAALLMAFMAFNVWYLVRARRAK